MFPYQTPDDKLFKLLGSKEYDGYTSRLVARQLRNVADKIDTIVGYREVPVTVSHKSFNAKSILWSY